MGLLYLFKFRGEGHKRLLYHSICSMLSEAYSRGYREGSKSKMLNPIYPAYDDLYLLGAFGSTHEVDKKIEGFVARIRKHAPSAKSITPSPLPGKVAAPKLTGVHDWIEGHRLAYNLYHPFLIPKEGMASLVKKRNSFADICTFRFVLQNPLLLKKEAANIAGMWLFYHLLIEKSEKIEGVLEKLGKFGSPAKDRKRHPGKGTNIHYYFTPEELSDCISYILLAEFGMHELTNILADWNVRKELKKVDPKITEVMKSLGMSEQSISVIVHDKAVPEEKAVLEALLKYEVVELEALLQVASDYLKTRIPEGLNLREKRSVERRRADLEGRLKSKRLEEMKEGLKEIHGKAIDHSRHHPGRYFRHFLGDPRKIISDLAGYSKSIRKHPYPVIPAKHLKHAISRLEYEKLGILNIIDQCERLQGRPSTRAIHDAYTKVSKARYRAR